MQTCTFVFLFSFVQFFYAGLTDYPASGQSGNGKIITADAKTIPVPQYRGPVPGTGMLLYRTKLPDTGMPMESASMPMPRYATYPPKVGVRLGVEGPGRAAKNPTI